MRSIYLFPRGLVLAIFISFLILTEAQGAVWYVNDASIVGDVFTTAPGDDANTGTVGAPFLTIAKSMSVAAVGDTIKIDVGLYVEGVSISLDSIALIGADSLSTVIDPMSTALNSITASDRVNLLIRDLNVRGAVNHGILFTNVYFSSIINVTSEANPNRGIYLVGSGSNILEANIVKNNVGCGFCLHESSNNTLASNLSQNNGFGFHVTNFPSVGNLLSGNMSVSNSDAGIFIERSDSNIVRNNISANNVSSGIALQEAAGNIVINNSSVGHASGEAGFDLDSSRNNALIGNRSIGNGIGFQMVNSQDNTFSQNLSESSIQYNFVLGGSLSFNGNLIRKNNLLPTLSGISVVAPSSADTLHLDRNWWGTADTSIIQSMISFNPLVTTARYNPFRLGFVDTALNADTTAPSAPAIIEVDTIVPTQVTLNWNVVNANEEGVQWTNDLAGYHIYRDTEPNPNRRTRIATVSAPMSGFVDTTVDSGVAYYYEVTSFDTSTPPNESFYDAETGASVNTPTGVSVPVSFPSLGTSITFASVSTAGVTTATRLAGDTPITGFQIADCDSEPFIVISTTAMFTTAQVTVTYDPSCFPEPDTDELALRLLHFDGAAPDPDDVTQSIDTVLNQLTSIPLTTFSPFVVALPMLNAQIEPRPIKIKIKPDRIEKRRVSVVIEGIDGAIISSIDPGSVRMLGAAPVDFEFIGREQRRSHRLMLRFRAADLILVGIPLEIIFPVEVTGRLNDGRRFKGTALIFLKKGAAGRTQDREDDDD